MRSFEGIGRVEKGDPTVPKVDTIPYLGIVFAMKHAEHTTQLARLRRIEGQVKGLIGMIEGERYCVDILTQARAIRAALKKVEGAILQEHVEHCVAGAFESGDRKEERAKIYELITVFGRYSD